MPTPRSSRLHRLRGSPRRQLADSLAAQQAGWLPGLAANVQGRESTLMLLSRSRASPGRSHNTTREEAMDLVSNAPKGNGIGAKGS